MKKLFITVIAGVLPVFILLLSSQTSEAGSATWRQNPLSGLWNSPNNWQPRTVPGDGTDTATFNQSTQTAISFSSGIVVGAIVFNPGASPYAFTVDPTLVLALGGAGLTNNSAIEQDFVTTTDAAGNFGIISFIGTSMAGDLCTFTTQPGMFNGALGSIVQFSNDATAGNSSFINSGVEESGASGGKTDFLDNSGAGRGTFFANAGTAFGTAGGIIEFFGASTAGEGTFTAKGGASLAAFGGAIYFRINSSAASGNFTVEGGTADFSTGGSILFEESATAGDGTFNINGGQVTGTSNGGALTFLAMSSAGNATLIANGGSVADAQPGGIFFYEDSTGGTARIELVGGGYLDNSIHNPPGFAIGSLDGDGSAFLGSVDLTVGGNNLSTTFSGVIQDGGLNGGALGSVTKAGTGTLTFSGANTYTGGTTVSAGTLLITNKRGSGTGTGAVSINSGKLGGTGKIAGAVTVGTGTGGGAFLSPGISAVTLGTLTIQKKLTFKADSTYNYGLKTTNATADKVVAKGVAINSGALFSFTDIGTSALIPGTVFTVIDNTAAIPMAGTFNNLADGSTFTVGSNTFKADYEGGTGNDLTLTVQ